MVLPPPPTGGRRQCVNGGGRRDGQGGGEERQSAGGTGEECVGTSPTVPPPEQQCRHQTMMVSGQGACQQPVRWIGCAEAAQSTVRRQLRRGTTDTYGATPARGSLAQHSPVEMRSAHSLCIAGLTNKSANQRMSQTQAGSVKTPQPDVRFSAAQHHRTLPDARKYVF